MLLASRIVPSGRHIELSSRSSLQWVAVRRRLLFSGSDPRGNTKLPDLALLGFVFVLNVLVDMSSNG